MGNIDEKVHNQFIRFGKGRYETKAVINLHKSSKVKLKGSFEYANDFVELVSELGNFSFSGMILSKEPLNLENEKKKASLFSYEGEIKSEKIKEIKDKIYYMLLDSENEEAGIKLKIKKKLPKPGKSEEKKVDNKFCQLEADLKYYNDIKNAFFWDIADCKKVKAKHIYEITDLIMPENEGNPGLLRLKTKRKGKIIRKLEIDKREEVREKDFEA